MALLNGQQSLQWMHFAAERIAWPAGPQGLNAFPHHAITLEFLIAGSDEHRRNAHFSETQALLQKWQ